MNENENNMNQAYANPYQLYPYYYPSYPTASYQEPQRQQQPIPFNPVPQQQGQLVEEQSYIENILRLNRGKLATVYMTFDSGNQANNKVFKGIVLAAGRDHIILKDPKTDMRYLLLMVYLDYVTFDEEINYSYPFSGGTAQLATYPPR